MNYTVATIQRDRRLTLWTQSKVDWLEGQSVCVGEAVADGCLFVTSLRVWAGKMGMSADDAQAVLEAPEDAGIEPPSYPGVSTGTIVRNRGTRTAGYTLTLGDLGLWNLLGVKSGPLQGKQSRSSEPVLVGLTETGAYLWSRRGRALCQTGRLSFFSA